MTEARENFLLTGLRRIPAKNLQSFAICLLFLKTTWLPGATAFIGRTGHIGINAHIAIDAALNILVFAVAGVCLKISSKMDDSWKSANIICGAIAVVLIIQTLDLILKWNYIFKYSLE